MENTVIYAISTIRVKSETKLLLDGCKIHPRETYDDVILRLIRMSARE